MKNNFEDIREIIREEIEEDHRIRLKILLISTISFLIIAGVIYLYYLAGEGTEKTTTDKIFYQIYNDLNEKGKTTIYNSENEGLIINCRADYEKDVNVLWGGN